MTLIKKIFFNDNKKIKEKSIIWNFIASMLNAAITAYMLMIVTRYIGVIDGGILAIASTLGYQLLTIGNYGMRNFQATDTKKIFSFKEYLTSRYITSIIMIISLFVIVLFRNYSMHKSLIVIFFVLFKWIDAYEDVYHGYYQLNERLDVACREQSYRYIFSLLVFTIGIIVTNNLVISCVLTFVSSLSFFLIFNGIIQHEFNLTKNIKKDNIVRLLKECFPLFISSCLYLYICNSPKYAIDSVLNDEIQSYFGVLFMPVFLINLISLLIYRPLLTKLANYWNNKEISNLVNKIIRQVLMISSLTVAEIIFAYFFGTELLGFVYKMNLSSYKLELSLLMIGGGLNALVGFFLSIITIIRTQKSTVIGYGIVSLIALLFSNFVVGKYKILGAAILYDILLLILALYVIITFVIKFKKTSK